MSVGRVISFAHQKAIEVVEATHQPPEAADRGQDRHPKGVKGAMR